MPTAGARVWSTQLPQPPFQLKVPLHLCTLGGERHQAAGSSHGSFLLDVSEGKMGAAQKLTNLASTSLLTMLRSEKPHDHRRSWHLWEPA